MRYTHVSCVYFLVACWAPGPCPGLPGATLGRVGLSPFVSPATVAGRVTAANSASRRWERGGRLDLESIPILPIFNPERSLSRYILPYLSRKPAILENPGKNRGRARKDSGGPLECRERPRRPVDKLYSLFPVYTFCKICKKYFSINSNN